MGFFYLRFFIVFIFSLSYPAIAHESQPATLEIKERGSQQYEVIWKAPIYYGNPHPARLQMPATWKYIIQPTQRDMADATLYRLIVRTDEESIEGALLEFPGLESTITDVYVRLTRLDSSMMTAVVRPTKPFIELRGERSWATTVSEYIRLGRYHILLGVDHLLFVLGLLLIVKSRTMLIKTITSFTIAHSITLALATLGYANIPLAPLNAAVALSILFLGPEIVRSWRGKTSLTIRFPWIVAFLFGLLHGFGFASGLSTTGMPMAELPWALLSFNVGVELGQLCFIVMALSLSWSFKTLEVHWPRWVLALPGYTVGTLGAYWTIQRTTLLFGGLL